MQFNELLDEAYNVNFNIITYNKIFESTSTKTRMSKIDHEKGISYI